MNHQSDIALAAADLFTAIAITIEEERGLHLETAIAAAGYLAGTAILKTCAIDIANLQPGSPVFNGAVNEAGIELWQQIEAQLAPAAAPLTAIPPGNQPRQSYEALVTMLWPQLETILRRHGLSLQSAPSICAAAIVKLISENQSILTPAIAKTVALNSIVQAAKTVPPPPYPRTIGDHAAFVRMLGHTLAQVSSLATREPNYPVWQQLLRQLRAMRHWTANSARPTPQQCQCVSIGLIAARELEPAPDAEMHDLITRLHQLNYFWRNWSQPAPQPAAPLQQIAQILLLTLVVLLLLCPVLLYTLRVNPATK